MLSFVGNLDHSTSWLGARQDIMASESISPRQNLQDEGMTLFQTPVKGAVIFQTREYLLQS